MIQFFLGIVLPTAWFFFRWRDYIYKQNDREIRNPKTSYDAFTTIGELEYLARPFLFLQGKKGQDIVRSAWTDSNSSYVRRCCALQETLIITVGRIIVDNTSQTNLGELSLTRFVGRTYYYRNALFDQRSMSELTCARELAWPFAPYLCCVIFSLLIFERISSSKCANSEMRCVGMLAYVAYFGQPTGWCVCRCSRRQFQFQIRTTKLQLFHWMGPDPVPNKQSD